ncbi:MAG: DUF2510 domain-containing protein [Acidimicrobiales bacterium]|jgi:hypothetical protein
MASVVDQAGSIQGQGVAAGWYPDPWSMAPLRYHDGSQWTSALGPSPEGYPSGRLDPSNATTRMLIPIGRTPLSIVAGYVALCSILLAPAPVALILGICALVQLNHLPGAYGRGRAIFAIVMGGLFTVALVALIVHQNA